MLYMASASAPMGLPAADDLTTFDGFSHVKTKNATAINRFSPFCCLDRRMVEVEVKKMGKVHVLIVDDSLTIRAMLETALSGDPGIKVVGLAADAAEAEKFLRERVPDVITLDIKMPGIDGLEFLSRIKAWHKKPVIMLSSCSSAGAAERLEALKRGAAGSFDKAQAMTHTPALIRLIKDAARGHAKPDTADQLALRAQTVAEA